MIAVGILYVTPSTWPSRNRLFATVAVLTGLSLLSETAQIPTGRDASAIDLASDMLGGIGFLCMAIAFSRSLSMPSSRRRYAFVLGISLLAVAVLPLARVSAAYVERAQMLPSLVRFDARFATIFVAPKDAEWSRQKGGDRDAISASILLNDGPWPGIAIGDVWPNWAPYTALSIEFENPGAVTLPINVRVHDREHRDNQVYGDRFNRRLELEPGVQLVRIELEDIEAAPAGRRMDMGNIDGLMIFATEQEAGRRVVIHHIRLE